MTKWYIVIVFLAACLAATLFTLWEYVSTVNAMYAKLSAIYDYTRLK